MRRLLVTIALLALAPTGLAAKPAGVAAANGGEPGAVLALPDGVTIGVELPRYLMVERRLEAIIDNQSDIPIVVIDVALRSPLFEPVEPDVHDYQVAAGRRQDLRMDVGPSICPPADEASMLEMTVEIDGERRHGLVEIDIEPLTALHGRECGEQLVFERADVEWGPEFALDGDVLTTTITVTRRDAMGEESMAITNVRGTVLYIVTAAAPADSGPLDAIDAGETAATAPVTMRVGRCEPHAVADVKKPFSFAVWVTIADSEPYFVQLLPGAEIQAALADLLQRCIAADDG